MNEKQFWNLLLAELSGAGVELQTKKGLWFRAVAHGRGIQVERARDNAPSCRLSAPRNITEKEFMKLLPLYTRWIKEEPGLSKEVLAASQNSVYIFAVMKAFIE